MSILCLLVDSRIKSAHAVIRAALESHDDAMVMAEHIIKPTLVAEAKRIYGANLRAILVPGVEVEPSDLDIPLLTCSSVIAWQYVTPHDINEIAARAWHKEWTSGKHGTYTKAVETADAAANMVREATRIA